MKEKKEAADVATCMAMVEGFCASENDLPPVVCDILDSCCMNKP